MALGAIGGSKAPQQTQQAQSKVTIDLKDPEQVKAGANALAQALAGMGENTSTQTSNAQTTPPEQPKQGGGLLSGILDMFTGGGK